MFLGLCTYNKNKLLQYFPKKYHRIEYNKLIVFIRIVIVNVFVLCTIELNAHKIKTVTIKNIVKVPLG